MKDFPVRGKLKLKGPCGNMLSALEELLGDHTGNRRNEGEVSGNKVKEGKAVTPGFVAGHPQCENHIQAFCLPGHSVCFQVCPPGNPQKARPDMGPFSSSPYAGNRSRCDPKSDQESASARPWGVGWWAGTHGEFLGFLSFDSHGSN